MNDYRQILLKVLEFHGHRCWASVAGVRAGLAALRVLGVKRSGGRQLHAFVEIGEEHGGICFGDGVQYATGCTLGTHIGNAAFAWFSSTRSKSRINFLELLRGAELGYAINATTLDYMRTEGLARTLGADRTGQGCPLR